MNNNINVLPTNLTQFSRSEEKSKEENKNITEVEETVEAGSVPNTGVLTPTHIEPEKPSEEVQDMNRTIEVDEEDITVEGGNEYLDEVILDNYDKTKQNDSITEYEFNDEDIRNVFYGSSSFQNKKKK